MQVFHGTRMPTVPSENLGSVTATCGEDVKDEDCLVTLKDQACKLGADIVWGVDDAPVLAAGKKRLAGRAAHTRSRAK